MWEAWVGKDRERPTEGWGLEDRDIAQSDCDADLQKGCGVKVAGSNGCGWDTILVCYLSSFLS